MYRIALIDMPFASIHIPSIALTQIKHVLENRFRGRVTVGVLYLKNDFAKYFGFDLYQDIATSMRSFNAGLGDWLFRDLAFPELPDNSVEYLRRYPFTATGNTREIHDLITQKRPHFQSFMNKLIYKYHLDEVDLVGFTSMFMQNTAIFALARLLKQHHPHALVVMGGANCESPMGGVIAKLVKDVDYVFSGPALINFPQFVEHCLDKSFTEVDKMRGVLCNHVEKVSPDDTVGEELSIDAVIELDYDSFLDQFTRDFHSSDLKCVLPFETSRGCWWGQRAHCTFCGLNGASMAYRSMKPELAIGHIRKLFRYSGKVKQLTAVDNILPKSYVREVLPQLMTPSDMELFYEVKADLSEEEIAILSNARVKQIQPGIEALATPTLKLMKKGTTSFQNVTLLKNCVKYEIDPCWNLLVGFPGETERTYERYVSMIPYLVHLPPPTGVYPVRFDRFSPYFNRSQEYGLELVPLDYYSLVYPFSSSAMENFAYYFGDNNLNAEYFNVVTKWIDKLTASVEEWKAKWPAQRGGVSPMLRFKDNTGDTLIYDSRFGNAVEHSISHLGKTVLKRLSTPTRRETLIDSMQVDGVDNEIRRLGEMGLIFEEDERLLSLVLDFDDAGWKEIRPSGVTELHVLQDTVPAAR